MTANRMSAAAWSAVALGVVGIGWGLWQLVVVAPGATHPVAVVAWLAGALIAHDAVVAPLTVLLGVVLVRLVPRRIRRPLAVILFVAASVLVLALPGWLRP